MTKKPRIPKTVQPAQPEEPDTPEDDAIIMDEPAPVTKITKRRELREKAQHQQAEPPTEPKPAAPRSKLRETLIARAKAAPRQSKKRVNKQLDRDIWERTEQAASFEDEPQPARQFSGRTVALLTVLFIAALIMAQPLQLLLEQQNDITQAQQRLAQEQQLQEELETQLERWEDPAYVQQQARERFNMVMPGERKYLVIDDEEEPSTPEPNVATIDETLEMGWADRLWGSILTSGQE